MSVAHCQAPLPIKRKARGEGLRVEPGNKAKMSACYSASSGLRIVNPVSISIAS